MIQIQRVGDGDIKILDKGILVFYDHEHNLDIEDMLSLAGVEYEVLEHDWKG